MVLVDGCRLLISLCWLFSYSSGLGYCFLEVDVYGLYVWVGVSDGMDVSLVFLVENVCWIV